MDVGNKIKYPDFGKRLRATADGNERVPPENYGRLQWIADEMAKIGHPMVMETARKWLAGETMPKQPALKLLADIMKVDPAFLAFGQEQALSKKDLRTRDAMASGAVNLIAGMIQMAGGTVAFPSRAVGNENVDMHAIIKGAKYDMHCLVGARSDEGWNFLVPLLADDIFIIGVCPLYSTNFALVEIDREKVAHTARRKNGLVEVCIPPDFADWPKIDGFTLRL